MLQLPSPEGKDSFLAAAVTLQNVGMGTELILPHEANAKALAFNEDIGLGAISRTGALPIGGDGQWLSLAEQKLKGDASLDYQALLWEMGSDAAERAQNEVGGLNITLENDLLDKMNDWFIAGGGKLQFVKPHVSKDGFTLLTTEALHENEVVLSMPMKLIMCKQTARNVLIANRGDTFCTFRCLRFYYQSLLNSTVADVCMKVNIWEKSYQKLLKKMSCGGWSFFCFMNTIRKWLEKVRKEDYWLCGRPCVYFGILVQ